MMRTVVLILLCSVGVILASPLAPESAPADPGLCGPFPKYYKEVIYNWMKTALVDAESAKIDWAGEPRPVDIGKNGEHFYGWMVDFKVNARNRFGAYTGRQSHAALIRDNQIKQTYGFGY